MCIYAINVDPCMYMSIYTKSVNSAHALYLCCGGLIHWVVSLGYPVPRLLTGERGGKGRGRKGRGEEAKGGARK